MKTQAPSPQTPDGISVRTPRTISAFSSHVNIHNLPWIQCLDFLELQGMNILLTNSFLRMLCLTLI